MMDRRMMYALAIVALFFVLGVAAFDYAVFRRQYVHIDIAKDVAQRAYHQGLNKGIDEGVKKAADRSIEAKAVCMVYVRYGVDVETAQKYARWTVESAYKYQIPVIILAGLITQESSCRADAVSATGAIGLTQVDWRWWGEFLQARGIAQKRAELFNPRISIEAGAAILAHLIKQYGDIEKALNHYSGGARQYVSKICKRATAW